MIPNHGVSALWGATKLISCSCARNAVPATGHFPPEKLRYVFVRLSTSYTINVTSRYVGNTTDLQQSGEATVAINQTSQHPMTIIINFQYPSLTINNSFALTEQQTGAVTTGKIMTQIIGFEFQYQLLISIRNDGVYESDYVILKTLSQGCVQKLNSILGDHTLSHATTTKPHLHKKLCHRASRLDNAMVELYLVWR
uniref:Uncharacterized protein n=1 Tax=Timema poppense TaxID=170557 RepID=A0A7R9CK78_TIMPO|nr:unnamed protein product [Timema poppensis]